jgi:hypothetical protein
MKRLSDIYGRYLKATQDPFNSQKVLDIFWTTKNKYKPDILQMLDVAINDRDKTKLKFCIAVSFRDGLDNDYADRFYKIILDTWHEEHEDIVECISNLKDEKFSEPLLEIAINGDKYRKFDDENESALRKCVHALKIINTNKSLGILSQLIDTKNPNVQYALDIYK